MAVLSRSGLFPIVDILGITMGLNSANGHLTGKGEKTVVMGDLQVPIKIAVVDSYGHSNWTFVTARCSGNLALLASSLVKLKGEDVFLHLINVAKLSDLASWLSNSRPVSDQDAMDKLGKSLVKSFVRGGDMTWSAI